MEAMNPTECVMWAGTAALFIYVIVSSANWEVPARLMPRALSTVGLIAIAGYLAWNWFNGGFAKSMTEVEPWSGAMMTIGTGLKAHSMP